MLGDLAVFFAASGGEHDDGELGAIVFFTALGEEFVAVHDGHFDVAENHANFGGLGEAVEGFLAVASLDNFVACTLEAVGEAVAGGHGVIDDHEGGGGGFGFGEIGYGADVEGGGEGEGIDDGDEGAVAEEGAAIEVAGGDEGVAEGFDGEFLFLENLIDGDGQGAVGNEEEGEAFGGNGGGAEALADGDGFVVLVVVELAGCLGDVGGFGGDDGVEAVEGDGPLTFFEAEDEEVGDGEGEGEAEGELGADAGFGLEGDLAFELGEFAGDYVEADAASGQIADLLLG